MFCCRNVQTKYGPVQGVLQQPADHLQPVATFLGIPFATPPLGNLRSEETKIRGVGRLTIVFLFSSIIHNICHIWSIFSICLFMNGWRVTMSMLQVHAPCDGGPLEGDAPGQQVRPRVPPAPAPWRPPLQHLLLLLQTVLGAASLHPPRGAPAAGPERGLPLPECLHSGLGSVDCNLVNTAADKPENIQLFNLLPIAIKNYPFEAIFCRSAGYLLVLFN